MSTNPQLELAFQYISQTRRHVYLTGKAGTGKTTFLHRVRAEVAKHMAVVAPTGVAAINAKGQTIHSLFQLPFGLIRPGDTRSKSRRFSKKKQTLLKSLDLLVIDEVSMVRADVLDGIDEVLRRFRRTDEPFGGVQLLMIGDLHQLPPVVKDDERRELLHLFDTPYFFGSRALKKTDLATIELTHIYRQSDERFIQLLNRVRNDDMNEEVFAALNERYDPNADTSGGGITLTSHNHAANRINTSKLRELDAAQYNFRAKVTGKFPESMYPNSIDLHFKVGAQVMFNRNDPDKLYFNGKIGTITAIDDQLISVRCSGEDHTLEVGPVTWENISYEMDGATKEVKDNAIGEYTQHPLRLAWAITIHKSQGLTFDKVIIDAADAFAHGQVYVALSRCKTLEGITLRSRIGDRSVRTDRVISNYSEDNANNQPTPEDLAVDKRAFQQDCLRELFGCQALHGASAALRRVLFEHEQKLQAGLPAEYDPLARAIATKAVQPGRKFLPQLNAWAHPELTVEQSTALKARLTAAGKYFTSLVTDELLPAAKDFNFLTDNQRVRESVQEKLDDLRRAVFVASKTFATLADGFDGAAYNRARTSARIEFDGPDKSAARSAFKAFVTAPADVPHPDLYKTLASWRLNEAEDRDIPPYTIAHNSVLAAIATLLPQDKSALLSISKVGPKMWERYGKELLMIVSEYIRKNDITPPELTTAQIVELGGSTYAKTLALFQQGCSIQEIAAARKLGESTVSGHLARYVADGIVPLEKLIDPEGIKVVSDFVTAHPDAPLGFVRHSLGGVYDYGQIRAVIGSLERLASGKKTGAICLRR